MKYLEKFLKDSNQSSSTKDSIAGNNQASVLLVGSKSYFQGTKITQKDYKQSTHLQYKVQKSANVHNNNALITELDRHTGKNLQNPNFEKCVTPQPTVPTPQPEKVFPGINIEPIVLSYPKLPSAETVQWIMQSVMTVSEHDQVKWFELLEQWATDFHDRSWADEVIARLVHCEQESQPVQSIRKDFDIAKQMFAGPARRVVTIEGVSQ